MAGGAIIMVEPDGWFGPSEIHSGSNGVAVAATRCSCVLLVVLVACAVLDAQAPDPHAYFKQLTSRPDVVYAYSLRDQAELDKYAGRLGSTDITYKPFADTYPDRQDAAKVLIGANRVSIARQVRVPITHTAGSLLLTWDAFWGSEFQGKLGNLQTHKTFQISSQLTKSGLWFEVRSRYALGGGGVAAVDARAYAPLGPNTRRGPYDRIDPLLDGFIIEARRWTRYWVLLELVPDGWDRVSLWVADEKRNAKQLYKRIEIRSAGSIQQFWLEFNSSGSRTGPPLVAYVRNVVGLLNVSNPTALMQRPGSSAQVPIPTVPAAPSKSRISQ